MTSDELRRQAEIYHARGMQRCQQAGSLLVQSTTLRHEGERLLASAAALDQAANELDLAPEGENHD